MTHDNRYHSTRQAWENIWNTASVEMELEAIQYPRAQQQIRQYLRYLPAHELILEAGSGLSAVVITLRQLGYNVVGLDYAVNALHISRHHSPDLPLIAGDVHALPHPDNSLGGYLSFGVLEHFEQGMSAALREAYRVLKPGGIAVITIPYPNIVWRLAQWRRAQQGHSLIDETFYESTYTREQLISEISAVGFDVIKAVPTSHSFTLWGLSRIFHGEGYYQTNALAETLGSIAQVMAPWLFNFMTMVIARK